MKKYWVLFLIAIVVTLSISVSGLIPKRQPYSTPAVSFNTDFAYDNRTFLPAIALNPPINSGQPVRAVVVPHHLLASSLIAKGVGLLTSKPPKTIIILSPNHPNTGNCDIITSANSWNTPFGPVDIDSDLLSRLVGPQTACFDDAVIGGEHGIAGLLPFIKYYLPETRIVPLAFKRNPDLLKLNSLSRLLSSLDPDVGLIASLDFSHGLSRTEAVRRDETTKKLITDFQFDSLAPLSQEYTDSPPALITYLKFLDSHGYTPQFLDHLDSSSFNGSGKEVTSYFLISDFSSENSPETFSVIFGGDVMLGRTVNTRMHKYNDFIWPFRQISVTMSSSDLAVVNLESPFGQDCPLTDTGMVFCADTRSLSGLVSAGVDVVNLANNHIGNQGKVGFDLTLSELARNNIAAFGTGSPVIKEIKGVKVALLGFNDVPPNFSGITAATDENIKAQVQKAKQQADLVFVNFHWGSEYSKHNSRQTKFAHLAIDSGADAVIGHHPHWTQDISSYKGKPIVYSLGNLIFDQFWSEATRKGLLFRLTYSGTGLVKQEAIPIKIYDYGQPVIE